MLYKKIPQLENVDLTLEERLPDVIQAGKIVEVSENTSTAVQDYDLRLDDGAEVVLHIENCDDNIPEVGDYFYICHRTFKFLWKSEDFEKLYYAL